VIQLITTIAPMQVQHIYRTPGVSSRHFDQLVLVVRDHRDRGLRQHVVRPT
jgi:hypothetical protein